MDDGKLKPATEPGNDNFSKASCKIYHYEDAHLMYICEGETIYKIYKGEKNKKGQAIQKKNELCKATKCLRIKIDKDGFILLYNLPNETDSKVVGKIAGDKIYACKKKDGSDLIFHATFKGDKTQAAVIAVDNDFFR